MILRDLEMKNIIVSFIISFGFSQDTFSIVAVNPYTGEVGSAGASCIAGSIIISDIHPGHGAIHTQSFWIAGNQNLASEYMNLGNSIVIQDKRKGSDIDAMMNG